MCAGVTLCSVRQAQHDRTCNTCLGPCTSADQQLVEVEGAWQSEHNHAWLSRPPEQRRLTQPRCGYSHAGTGGQGGWVGVDGMSTMLLWYGRRCA
jgi:hypothetical protein